MDANEATTIVLSKIKGIDPDNASKIMGYLLIQDLTDKDLIRLAFGPETLLHGLILKAKSHLGLPSPSPRSPHQRSDLDHPSGLSPFPTHGAPSPSSLGLCGHAGIRVGSPFLDLHFNARGGGVGGDFGEDGEYLSFLGDGGKSREAVGMDGHYLHRRSGSESDVGFGHEDGSGAENSGGGCCRPCLYFSRGFCKNGSNCKFLHGGGGGGCCSDDLEGSSCAPPSSSFVGSPGWFEQEELMRLKLVHQKRLAAAAAVAASQFIPGMSPPSPQGKYFSLLLQQHQQSDAHRFSVPGMAAGDEFYKYGRFQPERSDLFAMGLTDKANSASRQIYLTFPADSAFKDEDVSEYFSKYGPVQDVRIPYQQKRMFGFVTFMYPETVKLILAKGNPHFICDSRVLVKPYKEKGKVPEKRQQQSQQPLFERGGFSPSSIDAGEPYDHPGARVFHNSNEMMLRRKIEGQANLQQVIEMHGRRLLNLQLPDFKDDGMYHHMQSLSLGSPVSPSINPRGQFSPTIVPFNAVSRDTPEDCWNRPAVLVSSSAAEERCRDQVNKVASENILADDRNGDCPSLKWRDSQGRNSFDHVLPDSLFASPTKSSANHLPDLSKLADAAAAAAATAADLVEVASTTETREIAIAPSMSNGSLGKEPRASPFLR